MVTLIETLKLVRVFNCIMAMVGVWVGAHLTWVIPFYYGPAIAGLAAFFICAAGNIVNDLVDIDIDRVNRPDRVLVKGGLSQRYAFVLALALNVLGLGLALSVSIPVASLAGAAVILLYLYNYLLKRYAVLGNLTVSLLAALTFITGGVAVDVQFTFELPGPLIASAFALLYHLVREIVKDVNDIEGDKEAGIRTLPIIIGEQRALLVALALFFLLAIVTFLPVLYGWFGKWFKIIAIYVVELPLLAFMIFLWGNPSPKMLRVAEDLLKAGMGLGIVALILA